MADTVAVMNKGRIEQMGAPEELYELPTHGVRRQLPRPVEPVHGRGDLEQLDLDRRRHRGPQGRGAARARPAPRRRGHDRRAPREADAAHERARPPHPGSTCSDPAASTTSRSAGSARSTRSASRASASSSLFAQNISFGPVVNDGAEVWLSWKVEHGFGLADEPARLQRFDPDDDTQRDRDDAAQAHRSRARGGLMAFTAFANTGPAEVADAGRRRKSYVALLLLLPGVTTSRSLRRAAAVARRDRVQGARRQLRRSASTSTRSAGRTSPRRSRPSARSSGAPSSTRGSRRSSR